ncbi:hypothetical protein ACLMJK_000691 [Lecanora helva]
MARNGAEHNLITADDANREPNSSRTPPPPPTNVTGNPQDQLPTIRLIPHQDPRTNRPSLTFPATSRTLPHEDCVIRVGRYSERDMNPNPPPNTPSSAPIGFKSKVVSRRHCEFWCSNGQWYIKDMKSSSGTFLNHIRLSNPSAESKPFPVHDGDVVQLGIDFRGGEEMIFRCVKIRIEVNRGWQKTLNNYNVQTHKRLRDLGRTLPKKDSDTSSTHSSECSICLMSIAPCQSLFVAPCSHVWHFKCIRPIVNDIKSYPQFMCPNCRAVTDLEADVEDPADDGWEDESGENQRDDFESTANGMINETNEQVVVGDGENLAHSTSRNLSIRDYNHRPSHIPIPPTPSNGTDGQDVTSGLLSRRGARQMSPPFTAASDASATNAPFTQQQYLRPITPTQPLLADEDLNESSIRTPTMTDHFTHDGPMTPTNNAGPFVFDGSAGRVIGRTEVDSLSQPSNASPEA